MRFGISDIFNGVRAGIVPVHGSFLKGFFHSFFFRALIADGIIRERINEAREAIVQRNGFARSKVDFRYDKLLVVKKLFERVWVQVR